MESTKIEVDKNFCPKHHTRLLTCTYESCEKSSICKFCSMDSKEELKHLYEHFDNLKDQISIEIKHETKNEEFYGELNKSYIEYLEKSQSAVDKIFSQVMERKPIISEQISSAFDSIYNQMTIQFEEFVMKLKEKVNNVSTDPKSKNEIKSIQKELDEKLNFLSDPVLFCKDFEEFLTKLNKKIYSLKVEDLINQKFNFTIKMSNCNLEWDKFNSPIINVTPRGTSYWCTQSKEILEGAFECKIRVNQINSTSATSYWNYACGLIRPNMQNETSYYNDCLLFQSNGYCPEKYSGSGSTNQILQSTWKNGDVILIKRDEQGNVFFGINNETTYKSGFTGILGPFHIVMGFSTSINGDNFEMIELTK